MSRIFKGMFLDFFKRIFRKKDMTEDKTTSKPRKHKFEIQVYEADWEKADANNGQPQWRPVRGDPQLDGGRPNIIEVASKKELKELQQQYAMCDQMFKIIREIDPFPFDDAPQKEAPKHEAQDKLKTEASVEQAASETSQEQPKESYHPEKLQASVQPKKVKIVTIGDIEVKYDGDKVYQKQWIKLTPAEATNFRLVNDANNKIVSMNGKHLEAKKWVLVEETNDGDNDVVDLLLKG